MSHGKQPQRDVDTEVVGRIADRDGQRLAKVTVRHTFIDREKRGATIGLRLCSGDHDFSVEEAGELARLLTRAVETASENYDFE